jgi:hypothetical protein
VFVEEVNQLFDIFNSNKRAPPFKKLLRPLSNDSPHMGYWDKAGIGVSSWTFLKGGKSFLCNQKQYVEINYTEDISRISEKFTSTLKETKGRVPQGSVLGPVLFL